MTQLFAEKYNMAEAAKHLNKALAINANSADIYAQKGSMELSNYNVDAALRTASRPRYALIFNKLRNGSAICFVYTVDVL